MNPKTSGVIKGTNRSVVIINPEPKSIFETAFFVLKKDAGNCNLKNNDMISEANKIIAESYINSRAYSMKKLPFAIRRRTLGIIMFLLGTVCGVFICYAMLNWL